MRSIYWIFIGLLGLLAFHAASMPFGYGDIFWQVRAGELFWHGHHLKVADPFSWSAQGKIWFEAEWLIQIIFYAIHALGGLLAIRLLFAFLWLATLGTLFIALKRWFKHPAHAVLLLALFLSLSYWQILPAPRTVSMFLAVFFTLLWQPWQTTMTRRRAITAVLLFWFWCNVHAESTVWLGFVALHALWSYQHRRFNRQRLGFFLACLLVSFLTPHILELYPTLLTWGAACKAIDEVMPMYISPYITAQGKMLFTMITLSWLWVVHLRLRKMGWRRYLKSQAGYFDFTAVVCTGLALRHSRFIWMSWVPLLLTYRYFIEHIKIKESMRVVLAGGAICLMMLIFKWTPLNAAKLLHTSYYQNHLRTAVLPVGAAQYLLDHPMPGARMFNHYIWGGYLIYALYPQYQVFIDGRTFVYAGDILNDEVKITHGSPETPSLLNKYDFDIMVVAPNYFSPAMAQQLGWELRYQDTASAVYKNIRSAAALPKSNQNLR